MPAGSAILLLFGAANRDPRRYDDPDTFDINRRHGSHLTFGKGLHFCLGANLARLEGRVAVDELLNRWPDWEVDYDTAEMAPTSTVRGWEHLRIVVALTWAPAVRRSGRDRHRARAADWAASTPCCWPHAVHASWSTTSGRSVDR